MKVLITGPKWHDNSPEIVADGFMKLGHLTRIFYDNIESPILTGSKILRATPFQKYSDKLKGIYCQKIETDFIREINNFSPDFIFVIAGHRFSRKIILEIKRKYNVPVVNFVVDDPTFCSRTLLYDLFAYDKLFVIDRSWMPTLEFFNLNNVHWMPHAADVLNFRPLNLKKDIDIAFGGTISLRMPNAPSGYLRATILSTLVENNFKVVAYSGGIKETFKEFPALKKIEYFDGYKDHVDLNKLYNRAKIVLSVHSLQLKSGISPRVFDGAISGSFQLSEFKPELSELFPEGIKWFKNLKELITITRFYLNHDKERNLLAKKSYNYALNNHTFKNRAEFILSKINL